MKTTATLTSLVLLIICTATLVRADIARPEPKPTPPNPGSRVLNIKLEVVTTQSFGQRIAGSSTNTIVAGLFLFMSISFGGVWLARSSGKANISRVVALVTSLVFAVGIARRDDLRSIAKNSLA
jgi:hypothetical protein